MPLCLRAFLLDHRARCERLIAIIPLLILVGHSLLHWLGKMASSGEVRYMIVVAPFWGLLAARGWEWAWRHFDWRWPLRIAALATLLPVVVNQKPYLFGRVWGYRVLPMDYTDDMLHAKRVADWYRAWPGRSQYPAVLTGHTGIHYFLDISPTEQDERRQWTKHAVASAPSGTVLIWDPMFGYYNSDLNRSVTAAEVNAAGWALDLPATRFADELPDDEMPGDKTWSIWLSPKTANDRPTEVNAGVPAFADKARESR